VYFSANWNYPSPGSAVVVQAEPQVVSNDKIRLAIINKRNALTETLEIEKVFKV